MNNIENELHFLRADIQQLGDALMIIARNQRTTCVAPTFSLSGSTLTISSSTSGATIYYTLDGSTPTIQSDVYSQAITLTGACTVKAFAAKLDMNDSAVTSNDYAVVATPVVSVSGNTITATCATTGATIKYGTGNAASTAPSSWSTYSSPIDMSGDTEITKYYFKAEKDGTMLPSASTSHTHDVKVATPAATQSGTTVTATCSTAGATIKYTIESGTTWANQPDGGVDMSSYSAATRVNFKAVKTNCTDSGVYTFTYTPAE